MPVGFSKQDAQRIAATVKGWESLTVDGTDGTGKALPQVRYDLLTAYNCGTDTIPQFGVCYVVSIHSDGVRCAVRQCAYNGLAQVAVACGAIEAGAVGKVSMAVGQQVRVLTVASITPGITRLGATAGSYAATVCPLGVFLALASAVDGVALCIRTEDPAAPKIVAYEDGTAIGSFEHIIYSPYVGVTNSEPGKAEVGS